MSNGNILPGPINEADSARFCETIYKPGALEEVVGRFASIPEGGRTFSTQFDGVVWDEAPNEPSQPKSPSFGMGRVALASLNYYKDAIDMDEEYRREALRQSRGQGFGLW